MKFFVKKQKRRNRTPFIWDALIVCQVERVGKPPRHPSHSVSYTTTSSTPQRHPRLNVSYTTSSTPQRHPLHNISCTTTSPTPQRHPRQHVSYTTTSARPAPYLGHHVIHATTPDSPPHQLHHHVSYERCGYTFFHARLTWLRNFYVIVDVQFTSSSQAWRYYLTPTPAWRSSTNPIQESL